MAGPFSQIWAGGAGPTMTAVEGALSTAGVEPETLDGSKQKRVMDAFRRADDATARRIVEELVDLLELYGYFGSDADGWDKNFDRVERALEPYADLSPFGQLTWKQPEPVAPGPPASVTPPPAQNAAPATAPTAATASAAAPAAPAPADEEIPGPSIAYLVQLLRRVPEAARPLVGPRRVDQSSVPVENEYDTQDFVHQLLRLLYSDTRAEEWGPSYAGKATRQDFLIRDESTAIEVKVTRTGRDHKKIGDEIIVDQRHYAEHPSVERLIAVVYDLVGNITNPAGFEYDLSKPSAGGMENIVIVVRWPEAT